MKVDIELARSGGDPYRRFSDSIRDSETKRKYAAYLRQFLFEVPDNVYESVPGGASKTAEERARQFVAVAKKDLDLAYAVVAQYVNMHKERVERGEMSPNTLPNLVKPIRALLDANGVAFHWKSLYKTYPRPVKTEDRGYARSEIQAMMEMSSDLTDKVILTVFSSAGFRVEAWDYLCWKDVTFFRNDDGTFRGAALLVYRGDPEQYHTFITPEACRYLDMYREKWKADIGVHPHPNDPLLRVTTQITIKQLRAKGVKSRVIRLARGTGLRPKLTGGKKRHAVPIDHGFRKYFNTMMRRAKVDYLDKEDMMGHSTGLEKHYERYQEEDFERFPEYQKAIPFLTISDADRNMYENRRLKAEKSELEKKLPTMVEDAVRRIKDELRDDGWTLLPK